MVNNKQTQIEVLTLDYQLTELPSSQHRAGLAGLVLMEGWLRRLGTNKGICELTRLDEWGATLRIDLPGLEALFNEVYAATKEEQEYSQPFKNKITKEIIPPLREEEWQETNPKTGKTKTKKVYIYPVVVPKGGFVGDCDPSGNNGHWVKLWRDMVWSILRGVPATRKPFEARAEGQESDDAIKVWNQLLKPPEKDTVDLPSTYFLGAQASNAENVSFKDRAKYQFLLHFWPYTAQIYVPAVINNEGNRDFIGYALAIPDVARLKSFCEELPEVLRSRNAESGYRPQDSIIDLAIEGALDTFCRLRDRSVQEGERAEADLVLGIDIIHVEKQGNNIKLLEISRLEPENRMIDEYTTAILAFWSPVFRKQRLLNLVNQCPWYTDFEQVLCKLPSKHSFGSNTFRHDARESFKNEAKEMTTSANVMSELEDNESQFFQLQDTHTITYEALIYRIVGIYIMRKLEVKYKLRWSAVKGDLDKEKNYKAKKEKVAKDAFFAVRNRQEEADFINYFASNICSVPQYIKPEDFFILTKALYEETDKVRTLTMLALSAQS